MCGLTDRPLNGQNPFDLSHAAMMWGAWISVGLLLDLAAWTALRTIPVLAADPPGSAGAIALTWVSTFVLPALFAKGRRPSALASLLLGSATALVAVPLALILGLVAGFFALNLPLMGIIALSPPQDDYVARQATCPLLRAVFTMLGAAMDAAPAAAGAVTALAAGGMAIVIPILRGPRLSWRVAAAGGWAGTVLLLPDSYLHWLTGGWRTPTLLLAAALPSLVLVSWRDIRSN